MRSKKKEEKGKWTQQRVMNSSCRLRYKKMKIQEKKTKFLKKMTLRAQYLNCKKELKAVIKQIAH